MGNSVTGYDRSDHKIASLEKELPFLTVSQNQRKKRPFIFHSGTWKRIVESTRKRSSKSKINPSQSCPESNFHPIRLVNGEDTRRYTLEKSERGVAEKSQSCYVINTKEVPPTDFVTENNNSVVAHFQQPPLRDDGGNVTSYKLMKGRSNDQLSSKHIEAFSAKPTYTRINNNIEKIATSEPPPQIPSYKEAMKQESERPKQRKVPPPAKVSSSTGAPKKVVIQASTSELLRCLGEFVCAKCKHIPNLDSGDVISWMRGVDRSLIMQGWQDISFIMPSSVVFVYMLCRDMLNENMRTIYEVQATVLTCLYMSYSYMGNEISYPLRPFLIENDRHVFWARCCRIMNRCSGKMLRINKDSQFFTDVFRELKSHGVHHNSGSMCVVKPPMPRSSFQTRPQIHNSIHMQNSYHSNNRSDGIRVAMTAGGN